MQRKGLDFFETPLRTWLAISLSEVQEAGGTAVPLKEYRAAVQATENDLLNSLTNTWQK